MCGPVGVARLRILSAGSAVGSRARADGPGSRLRTIVHCLVYDRPHDPSTDYFARRPAVRTVSACSPATSTSPTTPRTGGVPSGRCDSPHAYHQAAMTDEAKARPILAELLGSLGEGAFVKPPLYVDYGEHISIGAADLHQLQPHRARRRDDHDRRGLPVRPNVQLLTPTHPIEPQPRRDRLEAAKPITIGDNVWLGGGVIVCPGVTIGDNSVVGAGSVVTRDVPANVVVVGNPARILRPV